MSQSVQSPAGQISEDGYWIWNGTEWVANTSTAQPQSPKKSSTGKKVLIGGGIALALLIGMGMATGSGEDTASSTSVSQDATDTKSETKSEAKPEAKPLAQPEADPGLPGVGDKAADGKFTFVVTGVRDGGTFVGDEYLGTEAQGRFVLVDIKVKNTGDQAQTLFGDNNVLLDAQGREFSFDSEAALYMDQNAWIEEINPGNAVNVTMVFDVPKKVQPTEIRLHDSMLSGGVTVDL